MDNESTLTIDKFKNKQWRNAAGLLHRKNGPALELSEGREFWYQNGKIHREDGPAIVELDGEKEWCLNGILYKTKESYFNALSDEAKAKCLFSEDFLNG
jgi:hypothetical protein